MNQTPATAEARNPLGYEKIPVLLRRFAIPSIIAMVVSSLYNICLLYTSDAADD